MSVTIDRLIQVYVAIRDDKDRLKKAYDEKRQGLDEQLLKVANKIDELLKTAGADSMKTEHGTCFYATKDQASMDNFEMFVRTSVEEMWKELPENPGTEDVVNGLMETGPLALMTKGLAKAKVKEFIEEHNRPPEGVGYTTSVEVQVRRPRGKATSKNSKG